ncbi:uncharacterized protein BT62DRAFT_1004478 [Guyanagaster necrorhizus]|uniref:Secreted protein n=1 Tax=Guyanagaster necrorhizus TaxID=856835 RepID=A0A9P7VW64_9AGAR|nr:uncharacterized protein BT62DRAFT_1004478 [Guyanagaster necrorhizus MCA 3950]KAG7447713.1 hypothetical protein BT62DRAFT_1004478 [Guyanagaster necrorhizus MCA 3950]
MFRITLNAAYVTCLILVFNSAIVVTEVYDGPIDRESVPSSRKNFTSTYRSIFRDVTDTGHPYVLYASDRKHLRERDILPCCSFVGMAVLDCRLLPENKTGKSRGGHYTIAIPLSARY